MNARRAEAVYRGNKGFDEVQRIAGFDGHSDQAEERRQQRETPLSKRYRKSAEKTAQITMRSSAAMQRRHSDCNAVRLAAVAAASPPPTTILPRTNSSTKMPRTMMMRTPPPRPAPELEVESDFLHVSSPRSLTCPQIVRRGARRFNGCATKGGLWGVGVRGGGWPSQIRAAL